MLENERPSGDPALMIMTSRGCASQNIENIASTVATCRGKTFQFKASTISNMRAWSPAPGFRIRGLGGDASRRASGAPRC